MINKTGQVVKSDQELVNLVLKGELEQYEEIINRYQKLVFSVSYKLLYNYDQAQELAHETFIRAYKFLSSYKPEMKFTTWLMTINKNLFIDKMKAESRIKRIKPVDEESYQQMITTLPDPGADVLETVIIEERKQKLRSSVLKLPPVHRSMIVMYYYQEMEYQDIADLFEIPVGTVKSRINRAKLKLLAALTEEQ